MKSLKSKAVFAASSLVILGVMLSYERQPKYLYNPTPSAPIGWYKVDAPDDLVIGDLVATYLPKEAEELAVQRRYLPPGTTVIKTIWAGPGDHYCVAEGSLHIKGKPALSIFPFDSQGRIMPVLSDGCRRVSVGHYLLISERAENSFDARYFGETDERDILGRVRYLGEDEDPARRNVLEAGWARGLGAEDKIKGVSAKVRLTPCLHITFYSAIIGHGFPGFCQIAMVAGDLEGAISLGFTQVHTNTTL